MKRCSKCKRNLPLAQFRKATKHPDGLSYSCKDCEREYQREKVLVMETKLKLNKKRVADLKSDLANGMTQPEAAKKYKCSRSLVSDIATNRVHKDVPWPDDRPVKRPGGQRKPKADYDPTNERILELESELIHVTDERNREKAKNKVAAKTQGLFKAIVKEMESRVVPLKPFPPAQPFKPKKAAIKEHVVLHVSDMHADQVVTPEECGGLERYDFNIACARAERYVDTVLEWTNDTLAPQFHFTDLWFLSYGDQTSGEIHGHAQRSYFRNMFRNCLAIGQLQASMLRDLAPYFENIHVVCLSGNHGRRSTKKDYSAPKDNWDTLIAETARLYCRDMKNVDFLIPDAYSVNLDINGVGVNVSHGDDVRSNGGIPWYGLVRRQKGLIALNNAFGGVPIRYVVCGHHHNMAALSDVTGELLVNGAWLGTDSFAYNSFSGYREPCQLMHGMNPQHGVTWRLGVKLKHVGETKGPKRYKIEGANDVMVPR